MKPAIITIDGPAGTGKSTVSRLVALTLELPHLDTGAYYRAATLGGLRKDINLDDGEAMADLIETSSFDQVGDRMFLDGDDVTQAIRLPAVTNTVSIVSAHPEVRRALVAQQRQWVESREGRAVVEGRDIGSIVFPDAGLKIYLDASAEVRAMRRAGETGQDVSRVLQEQERRDTIDSTRTVSPLTVPSDAVVIDTTTLTIDEVVARIVELAGQSSPE
ncbi:MAG: (d)CMP kinase [Acidimicrobiia bacterium]